jgi:hypothetical protein
LQANIVEMQHRIGNLEALLLKERDTNKMLSIQLSNLVKMRPTLEAVEAKNQKLMKDNEHLMVCMCLFFW